MGKVHILPQEVISKIAAGEIIERPASVIKELIENSLDAESTNIEINLKAGGKSLIQVKDNGCGIDEDDIEKIFFRHATSKITNIEDIYRMQSLGFRGEALYSIASISDVTLRSKVISAGLGKEIHIRGGEKLSIQPVNMSVGTEIEVRELFFNTPARKKFLKADSTELNQILNTFIPYALFYYTCRFILNHNSKKLLDLTEHPSWITRISDVLNLNREYLIEESLELSENINIHLILGDINIKRPRKDLQFIFINKRPVQNRSLNFHLNQAYRIIFPPEINPFFAVSITIPPQEVDVNIHPTKREVKIKDELQLSSLLRKTCEEILKKKSSPKQIVEISYPFEEIERLTSEENLTFDTIKEDRKNQYSLETNSYKDNEAQKQLLWETPNIKNLKIKLSCARFLGIFIRKYIVLESESSLLIVDQHAADERITYERYIKQIEMGKVEIQFLLTPIIIPLTPQELVIWEAINNTLEEIGFITSLWDKENIALHGYPQLIKEPKLSLQHLLDGEERTNFDKDTLAKQACHNSLTAGYEINKEQAEHIIKELINCNQPITCPHGRPTVLEIPESLLDKQFLRK
ncbi:MAG: DNA mismatch repair endonuclease MutL [Candidatus Omnitrophica bacterium]|nr:DNA mismatch repair endonuclease MutL [Candidatus Omnitrophota bacterium]